jgi:hypothetical protein
MLEAVLILATLNIGQVETPEPKIDDGYFYSERVDATDAPACSPSACNNNLGPACRPVHVPGGVLMGHPPSFYIVFLGCKAAGKTLVNGEVACFCDCYTGGPRMYGPCDASLLAAPVTVER